MTKFTVKRCWPLAVLLLALAPAPAAAQQPPTQQPAVGPPVQRIATASAISTEPLTNIQAVRELPDGRVLVNDPQRRRLLLMDTALKVVEVVLDSLSDAANFYGSSNGAGALVPFRGDTTLFIDASSYAMLVIDPAGKVVRVRSVWRAQDVYAVLGSGGVPGVDARGRIVYMVSASPAPSRVAPPAGVPYIPEYPDSAFLVAADIDTRKLDTLGVVRVPRSQYRVYQTPGQTGFSITLAYNPLPRNDGWAVLPDGTVAFVRAVDYRVEFLAPDGTITSSGKLPYDWQRLTDADKQQLVDSVLIARRRQAAMSQVTSVIRWVNIYKKQYPAGFKVPEGFMLAPGLSKDARLPPGVTFPPNYIYACPPGVEPTITGVPVAAAGGLPPGAQVAIAGAQAAVAGAQAQGAGAPGQPVRVQVQQPGAAPPTGAEPARPGAAAAGAAAQPGGAPGPAGPGGLPTAMTATPSCYPDMFMGGGREPPPPTIREPAVVKASELPDYRPPIPRDAVRADREGNLWIRTNPSRPTGIVYDIVNRQGELTTRLETPPGYTIVGFGQGKIVYLSMRDATGMHLARVRLR